MTDTALTTDAAIAKLVGKVVPDVRSFACIDRMLARAVCTCSIWCCYCRCSRN